MKKFIVKIIIINIAFIPCLLALNTEWSIVWNIIGFAYSFGFAWLVKKLFGNFVKDEGGY